MIFGKKRKDKGTKSLNLKTYGLTESTIRKKLKDIRKTCSDMTMLSHPKGVDLTVVVVGEDEKPVGQKLEAIETQIRDRLGEHVFGTGNDRMEEVVGKALSSGKKSVAIAESCTGGLICHWLTNVPGSSEYFKQGIIAYSNEAKTTLLGLSESRLKQFGTVSRQTVEAMAKAVRKINKTDIGLSVTGIAGPGGGTAKKPVGLTYIGLDDGVTVISEEHRFSGWRELIKIQASQAALDLLRRNLVKNLA